MPPKSNIPLRQGNINLQNRPMVKNPDGSISTVRSIGVNFGGPEILIPTVSDDGRILSNEDAIQLYKQTGKHLGEFQTPDEASAFAEKLHNYQAEMVKKLQMDALQKVRMIN